MKKVLIIAVIIIVVVAAAIIFLVSNLDSLVAKMIEKHGSEATGTSVAVSGVEISLREGRGSIRGLEIANPEGFSPQKAFSLDDITLDIDIESLRGEPVVIEEIRVKAPVVFAEITKTGSSNIDQLRKNVQENARGGTEEGDGTESEAKRLRIKKFVFEEGEIRIDGSALGIKERIVKLPEIRMNDIGGEKGATPNEIAVIVLRSVASEAASSVARSGVDELIKEKLGGSVKEKAKDLIKKIGG